MKINRISSSLSLFFFIAIFFALTSCSVTKYVPENEYVVNSVKIKSDNNKIKISKLYNITQTIALKKLIGIFALRARIYNIPNPKKDGIRKIREEKRLKKINNRRDAKFDRETNKLRKKRNVFFNKKERFKSNKDTANYLKANKKYLELKKKYETRTLHAPELKYQNHKKNVWNLANFFRKIGQKPQILDQFLVDFTLKQYRIYLKNQGYFKPKFKTIIDTISKKRVNITYKVYAGAPLKIGSISYHFPEKKELIDLFTKQNLRLKVGQTIDVNELDEFRNKISTLYRNNGYYYFSNQLITYQIDTIGKYDNAALIVNFKTGVNPKIYEKWYINNVYIFNDYNPNEALAKPKTYLANIDTSVFVTENNIKYFFLKKNQVIIKPKYLTKQIYLYPDSLFSLKATQTTYSHLSKYKIFKLTNIEFKESKDTAKNYLDCNIKLSPTKKTGIIYEIEATNSSLNNGAAANLSYMHKNLFHGGEILDLKLELALQRLKNNDSTERKIFNTQEYSFNMKLTFPRLLMPFKSSMFIMQNNPRTIISTKFGYQNRPEYNKIEALFNWEYFMKSSQYSNFIFAPLRFSSIRVLYITPEYLEYIKTAMLQESYEDHFIFGSRFSYIFSNQGKPGNNIFFQTNLSFAGNSLYTIMKLAKADTVNGSYNFPLFNTPFAQFVKTDLDFRYYISSINDQRFIFRIFVGVGIPYGNSKLMPFGEKYFSGGANSIRAWQARTLGPGGYSQPKDLKYINQTGDMKLETNFEYRFNIISILEGAFFIDAGNIWDVYSQDHDLKKVFFFNKFYRQIAVGTGVGLRLNLSYFVFRTDLGLKIVDPALPEYKRIIPLERAFDIHDLSLNIGIGYPF